MRKFIMSPRKPSTQEVRLLFLLIETSTKPILKNWEEGLLVCSLDDGKMGSLRLLPKGELLDKVIFGERVSEFTFVDADGVDVLASLNLDSLGNLFELDLWKSDFSQLITFPDVDGRRLFTAAERSENDQRKWGNLKGND
jgi:hypothetical protein